MLLNENDILSDFMNNFSVPGRYIIRNGFTLTSELTQEAGVYDAIVVRIPSDGFTLCFFGLKCYPHSVDEYVDFINRYNIEKALIITDNIDFVVRCPGLRHIVVVPIDSAGNDFDYTPLYNMPLLKSVGCPTVYGAKEEFSTYLDCSKIKGLESFHITNDRYLNWDKLTELKSLSFTEYKGKDLSNAIHSPMIDRLHLYQCKIESLEGIQKSSKLQCLYMYYNRSLKDISALKKVKNTLKALRIGASAKISDFSVLEELDNLELLEICGSNELQDLEFIRKMKNLKTFIFDVPVKNGDLSPCLNLSYARSLKNRKHYNLKDAELPKKRIIYGNESIEIERRCEV